MHILEKYMEALKANDANMVTECFCEDAIFDDTAPEGIGGVAAHAEGRDEILAMFKINFNGESGTVIPKVLGREGNVIDYDAIAGLNGEVCIPCRGTAILENGLIKEYYVRPRK